MKQPVLILGVLVLCALARAESPPSFPKRKEVVVSIDPSSVAAKCPTEGGSPERYRAVVDLNYDRRPDLILSEPRCKDGAKELEFKVFIRGGAGALEPAGEFTSAPERIDLEKDKKGAGALSTFKPKSETSGKLVVFAVSGAQFKQIESRTLTTSAKRFKTLFESGRTLKLQVSKTNGDKVEWDWKK